MSALVFGDDFDPAKVGQGGQFPPCKCHLLVTSIEEKEGNRGPYLSVNFEVIASSEKSVVGRETFTYINLTGKSAMRGILFAKAIGLLTDEDIEAAKESGTGEIDIDWDDAPSRTLVAEFEESEWKGKTRCQIEFSMFHVDDERAKSFPKNKSYLGGAAPQSITADVGGLD